MTSIYILKLDEEKYYVGKSNNVKKRYKEHITGNGSAWTRMYKPISIHKIIKCESPFDEDKITKEYMFLYGINNVRGGSYVELKLSPFQHSTLNKEIWSATDKCTRCGRNGHFVKDCVAYKDVSSNIISRSNSSSSSSSSSSSDSCDSDSSE